MDRRGPRKGHAYSKFDAFRQLPLSTQLGLLAITLLIFFIFLSILPSHTPSPNNDTDSEIEVASSVSRKKTAQNSQVDNDNSESSSTSGQQSEELLQTIQDLRTKLSKSQEENARLTQSLNKLKQRRTGKDDQLDEKKGVELIHPHLRGAPLGSFDWDSFMIEDNSTSRRFWVKTATNEEGHHFYRRILIHNGWVETSNPKHEDCYFLFYGRFVPNIDQEFEMFEESKHMINHIPGEFAVLNKEPFLHYMRNWSRDHGCDYTAMHPESYLIHLQEDCEDMFRLGNPTNRWLSTGETQEERDQTYWFWKPPASSFGRGIKVSTLEVIRNEYGFGEQLALSEDPEADIKERCRQLTGNLTQNKDKLLIQRAIHKPFLIKGSKFDFRAYILIANAKPYMVYFKFGHVRRCMHPFEISSKVKKVHVCNDYSDELDDPNFPLHDHIWDYEKFRSHLLSLGYTADEFEHSFVHNLKRLFLANFLTFKDGIPRRNGYWLLLGLDVAIGENFEVSVLEVNTNPSVHYSTKPWGKEVVMRNWRQLSEALELVYDVHLKTKKFGSRAWKKSDLVMETKYGWHLLYSDATSPPYKYVNEKCFFQRPLQRHPTKRAAFRDI